MTKPRVGIYLKKYLYGIIIAFCCASTNNLWTVPAKLAPRGILNHASNVVESILQTLRNHPEQPLTSQQFDILITVLEDPESPTVKRISVANSIAKAVTYQPELISTVLVAINHPAYSDFTLGRLARSLNSIDDFQLDQEQFVLLLTALRNPNNSEMTRATLINVVRRAAKRIESGFFSKPGPFLSEKLQTLDKSYFVEAPELKYLLFYSLLKQNVSSVNISYLFPHQAAFHQLMAEGKKKVLVMNNIKDGLGDELVRTGTLVQALLDFNPGLKIVLYTNRSFLYNHPRVEVRNIHGYKPPENERFDMVIHYFDEQQHYDLKSDYLFRSQYLKKYQPHIYITADKANDRFVYEQVSIGSISVFMPKYEGNVYIPVFRLCAELGLPFRYGTQIPVAGSLFTGAKDLTAELYWRKLEQANSGKRQVIIFNGFGGEREDKGYTRDESLAFKEALQDLITKGFFIIVLPNHQPWGTEEITQNNIHLLSTEEQKHVFIAPSPLQEPQLHKYLLSKADIVVTVEGGLMHLAYHMGKPLITLQRAHSGKFEQWFPAGADASQRTLETNLSIGENVQHLLREQPMQEEQLTRSL